MINNNNNNNNLSKKVEYVHKREKNKSNIYNNRPNHQIVNINETSKNIELKKNNTLIEESQNKEKENKEKNINNIDINKSKNIDNKKDEKNFTKIQKYFDDFNEEYMKELEIQEELKKKKENEKQLKLKGGRGTGKKGISPYKFNHTTRNNFYRAKTPSQLTRIRNSKTPTNGLKKELMKSKSNFMSIVKNQKLTIQTDKQTRKSNPKVKSISKKRKSSINFSKYNNDSNLEELKTISVTSIKTNKTNTTTLNTISNSRINNKFFETNRKKNKDVRFI